MRINTSKRVVAMRRWYFALAVVGAVSVSAPAPAQAQQRLFDGFYVGGNIGQGVGDHDRATIFDFKNSYDSHGMLIAAHAGVSWQSGPGLLPGFMLVVGIEADGALTSIKGDDGGVGGTVDRSEYNHLASVRGRLGLVPIGAPQLLLFGTLGRGFATIDHTNFGPPVSAFTNNVSGLTWGLGAQWAFDQKWSIRAEWRHYDFGSYSVVPPDPVFPFSVDNTLRTFTVGVSVCLTGC